MTVREESFEVPETVLMIALYKICVAPFFFFQLALFICIALYDSRFQGEHIQQWVRKPLLCKFAVINLCKIGFLNIDFRQPAFFVCPVDSPQALCEDFID